MGENVTRLGFACLVSFLLLWLIVYIKNWNSVVTLWAHVLLLKLFLSTSNGKIFCIILTSGMFYKALAIRDPQYIFERLLCRNEISQLITRHNSQLHFCRVVVELGRRSFSYFGHKLFNGLPMSLKCINYAMNFKKKAKCYFNNVRGVTDSN